MLWTRFTSSDSHEGLEDEVECRQTAWIVRLQDTKNRIGKPGMWCKIWNGRLREAVRAYCDEEDARSTEELQRVMDQTRAGVTAIAARHRQVMDRVNLAREQRDSALHSRCNSRCGSSKPLRRHPAATVQHINLFRAMRLTGPDGAVTGHAFAVPEAPVAPSMNDRNAGCVSRRARGKALAGVGVGLFLAALSRRLRSRRPRPTISTAPRPAIRRWCTSLSLPS